MTVEREIVQQPAVPARSASPGLAAVLSFVLPGLGQIAVGAIRRGILLGFPLVLALLVGLVLVVGDRKALLGVIEPQVILALIALDILLGLIHLIAIGDAYRTARNRIARSAWSVRRPGSPRLLTVLLVVTFVIHGALGALGFQAYNAVNAVFSAPGSGLTIPTPSFGPTGAGSSGTPGSPGATTTPTANGGPAWAADGRLNVLLIGGDAGPGRWNLRTDTMIVLSADLQTGQAALFGIPRNLVNAPLAPEDAGIFANNRFPQLLNGLWVYADTHRDRFPGGANAGFRAITGAVQQLVGVPLDGAIVVNLNGFVDLVNALGGVWIDVASPIHDSRYPLETGGYTILNIKAGCQHMDGHLALAYARSRHQTDDYNRMGRQQVVLEDLANQLDPIALITQVPNLLTIAGDNLRTTFAPADVPALAEFASQVDKKTIKNILFDPPKYPEYLTLKEIASIQKVVQTIFPPVPLASPSPSPSPSLAPSATPRTCPPAG